MGWRGVSIFTNEGHASCTIFKNMLEIQAKDEKAKQILQAAVSNNLDILEKIPNHELSQIRCASGALIIAVELFCSFMCLGLYVWYVGYISQKQYPPLPSPPPPCCYKLYVGCTALHWAAGVGHCDSITFLVSRKGLDVDSPATKSAKGRTALHYACRNGQLDAAKLLVQLGKMFVFFTCWSVYSTVVLLNWPDHWGAITGANVNARAKHGVSPYQLAVWQNHLEICQWLVRKQSLANIFVSYKESKLASQFIGTLLCTGRRKGYQFFSSKRFQLRRCPLVGYFSYFQSQHFTTTVTQSIITSKRWWGKTPTLGEVAKYTERNWFSFATKTGTYTLAQGMSFGLLVFLEPFQIQEIKMDHSLLLPISGSWKAAWGGHVALIRYLRD